MSIELQDKLYTSTQVSDILGVSLRTLYRYMEDGRIKSMRTASGRHRFTKEHIVEFLNAGGVTNEDFESHNRHQHDSGQMTSNEFLRPVDQAPQFNNYRNEYAPQDRTMSQPSGFSNPNPNVQGGSFFNSANAFSANRDIQPGQQGQSNSPQQINKTTYFEEEAVQANTANQNKPNVQTPNSYDSIEDFNFDDIRMNKTVIEEDPFAVAPKSIEVEHPVSNPVVPESHFEFKEQQKPTWDFENKTFEPQVTQTPSYGSESIVDFRTPVEKESPEVFDLSYSNLNVRYYKSDYSDLIELARKIKDTGKTKDLEYAFTLFAGLSLHFLIKPFTLLHFYANPEDMQIWKEELRLMPANRKEDANVGVLVNTDIVFVPTKEIAGFRVVDDKVLLRDLGEMKEEDLVKQFRQHLMSA